jgi:hypothetical protein
MEPPEERPVATHYVEDTIRLDQLRNLIQLGVVPDGTRGAPGCVSETDLIVVVTQGLSP